VQVALTRRALPSLEFCKLIPTTTAQRLAAPEASKASKADDMVAMIMKAFAPDIAATASHQQAAPDSKACCFKQRERCGNDVHSLAVQLLLEQRFDFAASILVHHPVLAGSVPLTQQLAMMPEALHTMIVRMHVRNVTGGLLGAADIVMIPSQLAQLPQQLQLLGNESELRGLTMHVAHLDPMTSAQSSTAAMLPMWSDTAQDDSTEDDSVDEMVDVMADASAQHALPASSAAVKAIWQAIGGMQQLTQLDVHLLRDLITADLAAIGNLKALQHLTLDVGGHFYHQLPVLTKQQMSAVIKHAAPLTNLETFALQGLPDYVAVAYD
jgi:hypothetical protein